MWCRYSLGVEWTLTTSGAPWSLPWCMPLVVGGLAKCFQLWQDGPGRDDPDKRGRDVRDNSGKRCQCSGPPDLLNRHR